jgi:hypothetical protein
MKYLQKPDKIMYFTNNGNFLEKYEPCNFVFSRITRHAIQLSSEICVYFG